MLDNLQTIKAIPTKYKGHAFRSRLEARWAVLLDHLPVTWDYEGEGFDLLHYDYDEAKGRVDKHLWYLPDFFIPAWDTFVEIKPRGPLDDEAIGKGHLLALRSGKAVVVVAGNPWPGEYKAWLFPASDDLAEDGPGVFRQSEFSPIYWLKSIGNEPEWALRLTKEIFSWEISRVGYRFGNADGEALPAAYEAARSAKFGR